MLSKLTAPLPEFGWVLFTNEICRHFIDLMLKDSDWKSMSKYYLNLLYQMISCNSLQKYFIFLWRITRGWMLHSDTSGLVSMPSSSQVFSISFKLLAVLPLIAKVIILSLSDMLYFYLYGAERIWTLHLTKSVSVSCFSVNMPKVWRFLWIQLMLQD